MLCHSVTPAGRGVKMCSNTAYICVSLCTTVGHKLCTTLEQYGIIFPLSHQRIIIAQMLSSSRVHRNINSTKNCLLLVTSSCVVSVSVLLVLMKRYHELTAVTQTENCIASLTENAAAITRNDSNCKYSTVVNFPNKHCHMNAEKL